MFGCVAMAPAERQNCRQIMFEFGFFAIAGFTGRNLRQIRSAGFKKEFPREHVIASCGGRSCVAVHAGFAFEPLAHLWDKPPVKASFTKRSHTASICAVLMPVSTSRLKRYRCWSRVFRMLCST